MTTKPEFKITIEHNEFEVLEKFQEICGFVVSLKGCGLITLNAEDLIDYYENGDEFEARFFGVSLETFNEYLNNDVIYCSGLNKTGKPCKQHTCNYGNTIGSWLEEKNKTFYCKRHKNQRGKDD